MHEIFASITRAVLDPADAVLDPSRRVFAPFLVGSVALALVVLAARGVSLGRAARSLVAPSLWLHRSARADYQLIVAKALLRLALFGSYGLSMLAIAGITAGFMRRHVGVSGVHASALAVGALYTLAVFALEDFGRFYVHRLMHRVPLLWEFHKVHHSAEVLTPFSLYRTHPVETALNGARSALSVGLATGLFAWTFGPQLRAWEILGVDAIGFVWTLFGANLRHSHVWLSYGRKLEHLLVSPAQHQVHHSDDPRHHDRNFGTVLAVWDWLFGSLYTTTPRREPLTFGLAKGESHPGYNALELIGNPLIGAGRRLARAPLALARFATACASLVIAGCAPSMMMMPAPRVDRAELLQSFGRCTVGTYTRFQTAADALVAATAAYDATPNDTTRAAARAAWEGAIDVWLAAEMLRYGPAGALDTLGGQGMREHIYAWPDVNRCLIDQQLVSRSYAADFASLSTSARGLGALEYLLFYAGNDNGCAATEPVNAMGTWAAIAPDELNRRKAAYARAAAADVAARGRALTAAWDTGGFMMQLTTAGRGSTLFATQQQAISVVAEAMTYLDTDVKDLRLGHPLGMVNCPSGSCPDDLESRWAGRGRRHLRNNLAGLRVLLEGCPAGNNLGFDDLLDAAGAQTLTAQLRLDLAAADAAVDAIPGDNLAGPFVTDRDSLVRAHTAIRELTDFLKMEFTTTLQITSQRVEGDHD